MRLNPPSIRTRFFRMYALVGGILVVLVSLGIGTTDYFRIRHVVIEGFENTAEGAGQLYARMAATRKHMHPDYLQAFSNYPGLELLCIYDADSNRVGIWKQDENTRDCPNLLTHVGRETEHFTLHLSHEIIAPQGYVGMVYMEAELPTLRDWLANALLKFGMLVMTTMAACLIAAHLGARSVVRSIKAVQRQIECLKQSDILFCQSTVLNATRETAELAASVTSLRAHYSARMVAKEMLHNVRGWHWEIMDGLLGLLRSRLKADSPLLGPLGDYHLLMQMDRGDLLPPPALFQLPQLLDTSLAAARRIHTPSDRVNLTASLQTEDEKYWVGQPQALEALLRHLLLIGLKRTRKGFVSLRLEIIGTNNAVSSHTLRLIYEDSGPLMQQWQLSHWFTAAQDDAPPAALPHDISWLLVGRLIKRMGGGITGQTGTESGITVEGLLPLSLPLETHHPTAWEEAERSAHQTPPLILVVEEHRDQRNDITELFAQAKCEVMLVETHAQAIELAPIMPFSAILVNATLADAGEEITRRLRYMMENSLMPTTPIWAIVDKLSTVETEYWQKRGVNELLLRPLSQAVVVRMCQAVLPAEIDFYARFSEQVRHDLSSEILALLPMMNRMLSEQVALLEPVVEAFAQGAAPPAIVEEAHAVKSAALTLGYFRLAGLMDYIEHAGNGKHSHHAANWAVITRILHRIQFDDA